MPETRAACRAAGRLKRLTETASQGTDVFVLYIQVFLAIICQTLNEHHIVLVVNAFFGHELNSLFVLFLWVLGISALCAPPQLTVLHQGTEHMTFKRFHAEHNTPDDRFYTLDCNKLAPHIRHDIKEIGRLMNARHSKNALQDLRDRYVAKSGCDVKIEELLAGYKATLQSGFDETPRYFKSDPDLWPLFTDEMKQKIASIGDCKDTQPLLKLRGLELMRTKTDQKNVAEFAQATYWDPLDHNSAPNNAAMHHMPVLTRMLKTPFVDQASDQEDIEKRTLNGFFKAVTASASIATLDSMRFYQSGGRGRSVGLFLKPRDVAQAIICARKTILLTGWGHKCSSSALLEEHILQNLYKGVEPLAECIKRPDTLLFGKAKEDEGKSFADQHSEVLLMTEHVDITGLFVLTKAKTLDDLTNPLHKKVLEYAKAKGLTLMAIDPDGAPQG